MVSPGLSPTCHAAGSLPPGGLWTVRRMEGTWDSSSGVISLASGRRPPTRAQLGGPTDCARASLRPKGRAEPWQPPQGELGTPRYEGRLGHWPLSTHRGGSAGFPGAGSAHSCFCFGTQRAVREGRFPIPPGGRCPGSSAPSSTACPREVASLLQGHLDSPHYPGTRECHLKARNSFPLPEDATGSKLQ